MAMTLEEKIAKAEATAKAKAEKEGLDEAATKAMVDEAVQKVKDADEKAKQAKAEKEGIFVIEVENNPSYCGIGAGGVQFANGKAEIISERMADWFREHDGYIVTEK